MDRAVIYARYSSLKQSEQSIDGQVHACLDYANRNNLVVVNQYIDRAKSGKNSNRPAFLKMLEDCYKNTFDVVLVYQYDRFGRNRREFRENEYILTQNQVKLISVTERVNDKDSTSIIVKGLFESIAEYYSVDLAQKVKRGLKESLIARKTIGGMYIFGYKAGEDKRIAIVPAEAGIVKEIFQRRLRGDTIAEIKVFANRTGFKNHRSLFNNQSIRKMLSNEKYTGVYKNPYEEDEILTDYYPQIIDKDTFGRIQRDFVNYSHKAKNKGQSHGPATRHLLTGYLFSGINGNRLVGTASTSCTHRIYRYYFDKKSDLKLPKEKTEDAIIESIQNILKKDKVITYLSKKVRFNILKMRNADEGHDLLNEIKKQKEKLSNIKKSFLDAPQGSDIRGELVKDFEDEMSKLKLLESKYNEYEFKFKKATNSITNIKKYLGEKFTNLSYEEDKKMFMYVFLNSAFVLNDTIYIYLNFDKTEKVSFEDFKKDLFEIEHNNIVRIDNRMVV